MSEHDRENAPSVSGAPRAGREYMTGDVGGTPAKSQGSSPSSSEKNGMFMHARTIALERARVEEGAGALTTAVFWPVTTAIFWPVS